jgi:hypothetical protein
VGYAEDGAGLIAHARSALGTTYVKIMVRFTARAAGFVEDSSDEVLEVGFSERLDGSGRSVLINRSTADGAIEAPFGMDSYCVSTDVLPVAANASASR